MHTREARSGEALRMLALLARDRGKSPAGPGVRQPVADCAAAMVDAPLHAGPGMHAYAQCIPPR
jgi:hypothetical protein